MFESFYGMNSTTCLLSNMIPNKIICFDNVFEYNNLNTLRNVLSYALLTSQKFQKNNFSPSS